jgi:hypothetical protein
MAGQQLKDDRGKINLKKNKKKTFTTYARHKTENENKNKNKKIVAVTGERGCTEALFFLFLLLSIPNGREK